MIFYNLRLNEENHLKKNITFCHVAFMLRFRSTLSMFQYMENIIFCIRPLAKTRNKNKNIFNSEQTITYYI